MWIQRFLAVLSLSILGLLALTLRAQPLQDAASLGGTSWQLVRFQSSDDKTLRPDDKSKYTIAFDKDGRVSTRIDCNRGSGTWTSAGPSQLEFGPLALTRAMCPPGSLQDRIAKDWQYVRSYIIKDGHLFLALMADGGIYEYEPISGSTPKSSVSSPVAFKGPFEYECTRAGGGDMSLTVMFYQTEPGLALVQSGEEKRPAFQVPSGSGAKYTGEGIMFWEKGGEAQATWSGIELHCKQR